MKKIICLLLCFVLLFSVTGCKSKGKKSGDKKAEKIKAKDDYEITVIYSRTDGFNPYLAKTRENRELCSLLFDPLINLKSDCTAEYCIASSAEVTGNQCYIHLNSINFTDGTPLTADDVIYSYNLAKSSYSSGYATVLAEITGAAAIDSSTVVFTASYFDPYLLNLLTFPIVKSGTSGMTDSDGVALAPVGSGKFTVSEDEKFLIRNDNYFGTHGSVKTVKLLNAPDAESIAHYVEAGTADLYYTDAAAGKIVRMSGKRSEVNLNRLVYIGVNSNYGALTNREMRYAISSAIDRSEIVTSAYYGVASAATSFFNPSLQDVKPTSSLEEKQNAEITVENLSKIGYNSKDDMGYYVNGNGYRASFTLLVNSDNVSRLSAARLIAAECKKAGIEIIVREESYERYIQSLNSGNFQLYMGEIQILPNMDMSELVSAGGRAAYGVTNTPPVGNQLNIPEAIYAYRSGTMGINDLSGVLLTAMPQIPICYRNGLLFYGNDIKSGVEGLYYNIYYSVNKYKFER